MSFADDPGYDLQWLEDELLEDEEDQEPSEAAPPDTMADRQAIYIERKKRKKANKGLKFLAFLETLAILGLIWWWIKWLY